jgi:hypothetical protein
LPKRNVALESECVTINFETDSYIPTNAIAENARQALKVRETKPASQRGMTAVGIARARDLSNKRPLSENSVRRMKAFFDRHEADKQGATWDEKGKGWQAWNGWGGDEGYSWSRTIVERLNKQQDQAKQLAEIPVEMRRALSIEAESNAAPEEWLDAVQTYRKKQLGRLEQLKDLVMEDKTIVQLSNAAKQTEVQKTDSKS